MAAMPHQEKMSIPVTYADRYVAFVDILGFSALVQQISRDPAKYHAVLRALRNIGDLAAETTSGFLSAEEGDLRAQTFSDCIVLSASPTLAGLWRLLLTVDLLAWELLDAGALVRGGVSRGLLHHEDGIVFGDGMIDAYRLESAVAKYPRIILSRSVYHDARAYSESNDTAAAYFHSRIRQSEDGPPFLHILLGLEAFSKSSREQSTGPSVMGHPLYAKGLALRRQILTWLDESMERPDVFEKIRWFGRYFDKAISPPDLAGTPWIDPIGPRQP